MATKLPGLGLRPPRENQFDRESRDSRSPSGLGGGVPQPGLKDRQRQAMKTGHVAGSHHETGVAKATPPKDWHKSSYPERTLAGGRELGHGHHHDITDREAAQISRSYVDNALDGKPNVFAETQRFGVSNGLQRLPAGGRQGQTIISPTPQDNVSRMYGFPETSIRQPTRGSITNEGSKNSTPNILGSGIRQDDPNIQCRVNESAASDGDLDDDYGRR
jgi:hypothetical protein